MKATKKTRRESNPDSGRRLGLNLVAEVFGGANDLYKKKTKAVLIARAKTALLKSQGSSSSPIKYKVIGVSKSAAKVASKTGIAKVKNTRARIRIGSSKIISVLNG